MQSFRKHAKRVEKDANLAHMIEAARSRELQRANHELQLRSQQSQLRNRILVSLPAVNYYSTHRRIIAQKTKGTCKWLYNSAKFETWRTATRSICLCCYGIPGSGKSILAASLIDRLLERSVPTPKMLVVYHYCDYSDTASLVPVNIVASLVKQILERIPISRFDENFSCPFQDEGPRISFDDAVKYLLQLLEDFWVTGVVIDGLDELGRDDQRQILQMIDDLLKSSKLCVRVFITSRPEERRVQEAMKTHLNLLFEEADMNDDVSLVIQGSLDLFESPHPLLLNEGLKRDVVEALVDGAKGM